MELKVKKGKGFPYSLQARAQKQMYDDIFTSPLPPSQMRLKSHKPLWSDMQPIDITHCWRYYWSTTSVVNHDLVNDPTVRVPGISLPRAQWCTLHQFRTGQGRCASCLKKWGLSLSELCACSDTEMMSHIVKSSPVNKLNGSILRHRLTR